MTVIRDDFKPNTTARRLVIDTGDVKVRLVESWDAAGKGREGAVAMLTFGTFVAYLRADELESLSYACRAIVKGAENR